MSSLVSKDEWFGQWFDSPYYHLLYFHRDEADARDFIDVLISYLQLPVSSHVLDLACGRGRHAIYMNQQGYRVTGLDLSTQSIALAKRHENERLFFATHDMRQPLPQTYDLILNLFTSFGYFDTDKEHLAALNNIHSGLRDGGTFVLDFMNAPRVMETLVAHNRCEIEGVVFEMSRRIDGSHIIKDIHIHDGRKKLTFHENVRAFTPESLQSMLESAGFQVIDLWGDYTLNPFDPRHSERIIFSAQK